MPNYNPIFTSGAEISWPSVSAITTVNTGATNTAAYDGTANANLVFSAGPGGSFLQKLVFESGAGSNAASVARVFINNGLTPATPANNNLYHSISLPTTTAVPTTANPHIELPLNIQLPPGYRIYVAISAGASPLTGGWIITAIGGDY